MTVVMDMVGFSWQVRRVVSVMTVIGRGLEDGEMGSSAAVWVVDRWVSAELRGVTMTSWSLWCSVLRM